MATAKGSGRKKSAKPRDPEKAVIEAAMKLAAEKGWRGLSLAGIGEEAGLTVSELFKVAPNKSAILEALSRRADAEVLSEGQLAADDGSPRDRLFDVIMRRFDALQPYRAGLGEVIYDLGRSPLDALVEMPGLKRTAGLMLEAAGIDSSGLKGLIRIKGLALVYLLTLRTWLKDETEDLSKTMAALDGYLRRIEPLAERFERSGTVSRRTESGEDDVATDNS